MKKLLIAITVAAAAISVNAQTNQVLSRNAVGYEKFTLQTNKMYLLRNDFVALSGVMAISNAIGQQVPPFTQISLWDEGLQAYQATISQNAGGSWGPRGSNRLNRGSAFFIKLPATAPSNQYQLFLMGEVPDATTAPTTTMQTALGLSHDGYPYPVETKWTNMQYSKSVPPFSQIITWNETNQAYNAAISKNAAGSWGPQGNALIIRAGQGFFVSTTNITSFSEVKPYTWP